MSRRSILLLVATVVLLYFSVIAFMVSPLHGARRAYFRGRLARGGPVAWCRGLRRRPRGPAVALVSYPGSGNTWLRYLLQQVTGIMTGSVYMDYGLRVHGFPAENVTDGSVLVVKTHELPPLQPNKFEAAVLLIRNPRDAILADFNRLHKGHIGTAPRSAFERKSHEHRNSEVWKMSSSLSLCMMSLSRESARGSGEGVGGPELIARGQWLEGDWAMYVARQLMAWQALHEQWLTRFAGRVLLVFYEALVHDPRTSLYEMLDFLNYTVTEEDMTCAIHNKEGIYRRRRKLEDFDPFTADMCRALGSVHARVMALVAGYQRTHKMPEKANLMYVLRNFT